MAIIQTPSIAAVVEDQTPQLGGDLDCQDYQINDVGLLKWYDDTLPYQASVLFGNTLYFKPTVDTSAKYLFRGAGANKNLQHSILSSEIITYIGSDQSLHTYRGQNASMRFRWRAGDGSNVNAELGTDYLELKDGANPFTQTIFNTYTDVNNFEALSIGWDTNVATIETTAAGTGTARGMNIKVPTGKEIQFLSGTTVLVQAGTTNTNFASLNVRPVFDSYTNLGSTTKRWLNTYTDTITIGNGVDAILAADADNELALRNGTNSQSLNIYATYTDSFNYERLQISHGGSGPYYIQPQAAGTGTMRGLYVGSTTSLTNVYGSAIRLHDGPNLMVNIDSSYATIYGNGIRPHNTGGINSGSDTQRWATTYTDTITIGDGVDAVLTADADNELALRNGTNAQKMSVYNTWTDGANWERLQFRATATASYIETTSSGTGADRALFISNGSGTNRGLVIGSTVQTYTDLTPLTDSVLDLGATTKRWATTYTDGIATDVETFTAASDTLNAKNNVALCDCTSNNITINLPAASTASGLQYHIKKIDASANTLTIDGNGSETIDGSLTKVISTQYNSITVVSDGSNWFII